MRKVPVLLSSAITQGGFTLYNPGAEGDGGYYNALPVFSISGMIVGVQAYSEICFMRFPNINLAQGVTIVEANLQVVSFSNESGGTLDSVIHGHDVDDAVAPTNFTEAVAKRSVVTTALMRWDGISAWEVNVLYTAPSITAIIQELVNRVGWSSGQAMMLWWSDSGSSNAIRKPYDSWAPFWHAPRLWIKT